MSIAAMWSIINTIFLSGIIIYIFLLHKYLNKNDIVDYVSQIFRVNRKNLEKDLEVFLQEVKKEYKTNQDEIIGLLQEQQKEVEKLKKVIINESSAFKQYCQDRIKAQEKINKLIEKRLSDSQKYSATLEKKLDHLRRKIGRLKNETKTS